MKGKAKLTKIEDIKRVKKAENNLIELCSFASLTDEQVP